jgi:hypothetical protein
MGGRKGFTPEQGIGKLREAEVLLSKGSSGAAVRRKIMRKRGQTRLRSGLYSRFILSDTDLKS